MFANKHSSSPSFAALALVLALGGLGCTVTPRPAESPATPAAWRESPDGDAAAATEPAQLATWWQRFDDPKLDALIERVLEGNLDLRVAATRVREARARRGIARAALLPTVDGRAGGNFSERLDDGGGLAESYGIGLDVAWEADLFGGNKLAIAAAQGELEASEYDADAVRVALIADTVNFYTDLRVLEARLVVVREGLASRRSTLELVGWREQAGLASALEVAQARASVEQTEASIPSLEQALTDARLQLDLLAGAEPGALDDLLGEGLLPTAPTGLAAGIPADTLRQRPDLRAAESRLRAALARLGQAETERFPSLRLSGSLDSGADRVGNLFDLDAVVASLFASLTAPIFDGGRIRRNIEIQDTAVERAELAWRDALLQSLAEVESALASHRHILERQEALDRATASAREAAELADNRYQSGLIDFLTVLETQRTLLNLEEQRVAARGDLIATVTSLYRALGGGWDAAAPGDSNG